MVLGSIFCVSYNVYSKDVEKITIYVDEHPLLVEVVNTPADRARGLMYRKSMGENEGMLFVLQNRIFEFLDEKYSDSSQYCIF